MTTSHLLTPNLRQIVYVNLRACLNKAGKQLQIILSLVVLQHVPATFFICDVQCVHGISQLLAARLAEHELYQEWRLVHLSYRSSSPISCDGISMAEKCVGWAESSCRRHRPISWHAASLMLRCRRAHVLSKRERKLVYLFE